MPGLFFWLFVFGTALANIPGDRSNEQGTAVLCLTFAPTLSASLLLKWTNTYVSMAMEWVLWYHKQKELINLLSMCLQSATI